MSEDEQKQGGMRNSEPPQKDGTAVPSSAEELGTRLKEVCVDIGWEVAAGAVDRSVKQMRRYVQGDDPPLSILRRLAEAAGVRLEWLVTGERPKWHQEPTGHEAASNTRLTLESSVDEELFGRLIDGIKATYREEGVGLPDIELGRLAARMHNDLVADYDDPDERRIAVKAALSQLRRSLHDTPAGADSKRRA